MNPWYLEAAGSGLVEFYAGRLGFDVCPLAARLFHVTLYALIYRVLLHKSYIPSCLIYPSILILTVTNMLYNNAYDQFPTYTSIFGTVINGVFNT